MIFRTRPPGIVWRPGAPGGKGRAALAVRGDSLLRGRLFLHRASLHATTWSWNRPMHLPPRLHRVSGKTCSPASAAPDPAPETATPSDGILEFLPRGTSHSAVQYDAPDSPDPRSRCRYCRLSPTHPNDPARTVRQAYCTPDMNNPDRRHGSHDPAPWNITVESAPNPTEGSCH